MNTNKVIFAVLGVLIMGVIIFLVKNLNSENTDGNSNIPQGDLSIWIMHDDVSDFDDVITGFKEAFPSYNSKNIIVESFDDPLTYSNTLASSIILDKSPDIFVQSNSEVSPFENQIMGINPSSVSPNDFRLRFNPVFGEDLIVTDPSDSTVEFLKGIPAGYETLGIYYNKRYFLSPSSMTHWSDFLKEVQNISDKYSDIIPVALGNGSGITRAGEIVSSLFVLEGKKSLLTTDTNQVTQVLGMYSGFGERNGDNRYNILSAPYEDDIDVDYFAQGDVAAMIGYPRDLLEIDKIGYKSTFLFAAPFPKYLGSDKKVSINYNYFVINKDTDAGDIALDFLTYLASQEGQQLYSDTFPYYLSADTLVASEMTEKKILPGYNIVYKNFVSLDDELVSYDLGNKNIFNNAIIPILDLDSGQDVEFNKMSSYIICSTSKQNTLINLSSSCN